MVYKVVPALIQEYGRVTEGKRKRLYQTPAKLEVGGLYFVGKGKLVRVLADVTPTSHLGADCQKVNCPKGAREDTLGCTSARRSSQ